MQTDTFFMNLSHTCVWHAWEVCEVCSERAVLRKMCVRQVSVCTRSVAHTEVATTCARNPLKTLSRKNFAREEKWTFVTLWPFWQKTKLQFVFLGSEPFKSSQTSSFHVRLDLSCWYLFHQLAFHQSLILEASRFLEACVSERPTFLIPWFSMMPLYLWILICISSCWSFWWTLWQWNDASASAEHHTWIFNSLHVLLVLVTPRPAKVKVPRLQLTLGLQRHAWNVGVLWAMYFRSVTFGPFEA